VFACTRSCNLAVALSPQCPGYFLSLSFSLSSLLSLLSLSLNLFSSQVARARARKHSPRVHANTARTKALDNTKALKVSQFLNPALAICIFGNGCLCGDASESVSRREGVPGLGLRV
jgi:hypothetical protein